MTTFTSEDREWAYWHTYESPKYTKQTEIEFFWPLTEQIPLPLDYTVCDTPKYTYQYSSVPLTDGTATINFVPTWTTTVSIDTNNFTITSANKPPLYRRLLYKLLGINWKQS